MNQEVTDYVEGIQETWQKELVSALREVVREAMPDATERMQYKKPHFLKNGKYAAVISVSKDAVSFTIFNAAELALPEGVFEGPPERKTLKLRKGGAFDSGELTSLLAQASSSL